MPTCSRASWRCLWPREPAPSSVSHYRVGAGHAGTPRGRVSVSLSAAEQDILPDGPQRERAQVVPKDPGGVAAQVPEPPGRRRAVTLRPPLAAGPCPTQPAASGRFQTTCRPSQGGRRRRNLAAFLFKRKEEKKHPTTQRTKPITKRNSGSLCLLSVLCGALHALLAVGTSAVHVRLAPAPTRGQTRGTNSPPRAHHARPAVAPGPRRVSGLSLPLDHRGTNSSPGSQAGPCWGASSCAGGGFLAFVRFPFLLVPGVWPDPHDRAWLLW